MCNQIYFGKLIAPDPLTKDTTGIDPRTEARISAIMNLMATDTSPYTSAKVDSVYNWSAQCPPQNNQTKLVVRSRFDSSHYPLHLDVYFEGVFVQSISVSGPNVIVEILLDVPVPTPPPNPLVLGQLEYRATNNSPDSDDFVFIEVEGDIIP